MIDKSLHEHTGQISEHDSFSINVEHLINSDKELEDLMNVVSDKMLVDESLYQRIEDLERSNSELEQFAYIVAHDLQEPLRMVTSYIGLLERHLQDRLDSNAQEYIWYAMDGANRMQRMIKGLLTYARVSANNNDCTFIDCELLLQGVLADLKLAIEEGGVIVTHDLLPIVVADESQLAQLFQNLITNAIKFRGEEFPHIHVSAKKERDFWIFSVSDNGIGISPEYFGRIFNLFQRLWKNAEYPGAGIGLAICKKIVEHHGGRIWVESKSGEGATFYFSIPRGEDGDCGDS